MDIDASSLQTSSSENTIPSTQQKISISLTAPIETNDNTTHISGYISREEMQSSIFNIAYIIDTSSSMFSKLQGSESIPDKNADGYNNTLMDGAISAYEQLNQDLISSGLGDSFASVISFNSYASTVYTGLVNQDENADGIIDINMALETLTAYGATSFDLGLQEAINFFQSQNNNAENQIFFISDGSPNGGSYTDEVSTLLTDHSATIRALGLGQYANIDELDYVDDGLDNNSAVRVLNPSDLAAGLSASPIDAAEISSVEIYVNQNLVKTLLPEDFVSTAVGLQYNVDLDSLLIDTDDTVSARVIANDPAATYASTLLKIATPVTTETTTETTIPSKLFLAVDDKMTLFNDPEVFGAAGTESIGISGSAGATIDQSIERVEFSQVINNYTFSLQGNVLSVNLDGSLAAKIAINNTTLAFLDGSANVIITGLGQGTLGGGVVTSVESKVTGVTLNSADRSEIGELKVGEGGTAVHTINVSPIGFDDINAGGDSFSDASSASMSLNFSQGSYLYTVDQFTIGDSLNFASNTSVSITNFAVDGELLIQASDANTGTTVKVSLTGLDLAVDSTILDTASFKTAFGVDSLTF